MKNLISSILRSSEERIKNPFIGSFIISFLALNWKAILVILFSSKIIEKRIDIVENDYNSVSTYLILPLIIAVVYVAVLPYVMWLFDKIGHFALKGRKDSFLQQRLIDIKGQQALAEEEVKLENLRADYKEKSDLNRKITNLSNELIKKDDFIDSLETENSELKTQLSDTNEHLKSNTEKYDILLEKKEEIEKEKKRIYQEYHNYDKSFIDRFIKDITELLKQTEYPKDQVDELGLVMYFEEDLITKVHNLTNKTDKYYLTPKGKAMVDQYFKERMDE
ncbi:hypothetical protein [Salinimicrobium sediminilitoris]|uniref:hypothetical protein n=1 Tax=Salinimicrobium sediminilitoris TaxID=2876715 RepID=UPI001E544782|nr:hypothetical protein [Salinimicrobium sediminilitoris]MCC8359713.1 hypothetical protein [Salinimicrobium sediminilitoris]